jgi:hypothetical protein
VSPRAAFVRDDRVMIEGDRIPANTDKQWVKLHTETDSKGSETLRPRNWTRDMIPTIVVNDYDAIPATVVKDYGNFNSPIPVQV